MPRNDSHETQTERTEFSMFVNVRLRKVEKEQLKAWRKKCADNPLPFIVELTESGYLFSCKEDKIGSAYIATINGYYVTTPVEHHGVILSARAANQYDAIWEVLFWHYVIAEKGDWGLL